jgi:hypothetical protein
MTPGSGKTYPAGQLLVDDEDPEGLRDGINIRGSGVRVAAMLPHLGRHRPFGPEVLSFPREIVLPRIVRQPKITNEIAGCRGTVD